MSTERYSVGWEAPVPGVFEEARPKAEGSRVPVDPPEYAQWRHHQLGPPTYRDLPW